MVEYELHKDGFYIVTHSSQEVGTTVPVNRKTFRTKNKDNTFTMRMFTAQHTFVDDNGYLQKIELIDNSAERPPSIGCRNARTYVTIYEDYAELQHPEREYIAIEDEKWHIFLFDVDTWNRLIPKTQTISYEIVPEGYILKRVLTHEDSLLTISYKIKDTGFADNGIKIENNSAQDIDIRFALTAMIPYPTIIKDDGDELTPTNTEEKLTETIDNFKVKVNNIIKLKMDVSSIKQHIWEWTHQRIDVNKIKIGIITNEFTVASGSSLEYWF